MPIDKTLIEPILASFQTMIKDLESKNIKDENYEKMKQIIVDIENLANATNDFNDFNAKVTANNYYVEFSNTYSKALLVHTQKQSMATTDEQMLENMLQAYRNAILQLKGHPDEEVLTATLKQVIELGESGISFPVFLRILEEKGLTELLKGNVITREYLEKQIAYYKKFYFPVHVAMYAKMLNTWDDLGSKSPYNVADSFEFSLERQKIEAQFIPELNKWQWIIDRWERILDSVNDWLDSFCSFAPYDARWAAAGSTDPSTTKKNIKRTQITAPYYLEIKLNNFKNYFNLTWDDIFCHPTYLNEKNANRIWLSDEKIALLREVFPLMKPGGKPADEMIKKSEKMQADGTYRNPHCYKEMRESTGKIN